MKHAPKHLVQLAKSLHRRRHRYAERLILIEGEKVIAEAIAANVQLHALISTEAQHATASGLAHEDLLFQVDSEEMERISTMDTAPGIIAIAHMPVHHFGSLSEKRRLACFVDCSDPGNLGTMVRTADWFGIEGIILTKESVDPYNPKVIRSAMGSLFHMPIYQSEDLPADLQSLRSSGVRVVATDAHGSSDALPVSERLCVMMGSESHGLPPECQTLADHTYTIPRAGKAESLNVAMSFGITLYALSATK